jgi:hypothetical protein
MPARDQEDVDERPEQVADVGGEKIERVERVRDGDHRERPKSGPISSPVAKRRLSDLRSAEVHLQSRGSVRFGLVIPG